jgi:hypothetical protein
MQDVPSHDLALAPHARAMAAILISSVPLQVRTCYTSLEQAVQALEELARKHDALPAKMGGMHDTGEASSTWQGMHDLLGQADNLDGIFRDLHDYSRFSSINAPAHVF